MKISLCMITKDEEDFLAKCLDCIKDYVDEIIIVDTGSVDNTCNIAINYKTKLFHQLWENDFSKPRNFGIEKASGEWILVLDADEVLEHGELLGELVNNADTDIDGYLFNIQNYANEELSHVEHSVSARLFRNKPELRFSGAIHEQLPLKESFVVMTDFIIHHYGYIPSINEKKNKSKRNLDILMNELSNNSDDGFIYYNLGCEYVRLNQFENAIAYFKEAFKKINEKVGYESRLYKMMGISLLTTKEWNNCLQTIVTGISKFPNYPDLYYIRGLCYETIGCYSEAIADFTKCLELNDFNFDNDEIYVLEDGITTYKAYYHLGLVYEKINKPQDALNAYAKALNVNRNFKEPLLNIVNMFENNQKDLITFLETEVLKNQEDKINYAKKLYEMKMYHLSIALFNNIEEKKLINKESIPYLASSLWISGNHKKAKQLLSNSLSPSENYLKVCEIILNFGEEQLLYGSENYPDSLILKKKLDQIQLAIKSLSI